MLVLVHFSSNPGYVTPPRRRGYPDYCRTTQRSLSHNGLHLAPWSGVSDARSSTTTPRALQPSHATDTGFDIVTSMDECFYFFIIRVVSLPDCVWWRFRSIEGRLRPMEEAESLSIGKYGVWMLCWRVSGRSAILLVLLTLSNLRQLGVILS